MLTPAPVDGKFVDNGEHEYNTSLKMTLTPENFRASLIQLLYLAKSAKYDIDEYNCTDFALDVFNLPEQIRYKYQCMIFVVGLLPEAVARHKGYFRRLKQMKASGNAEAENIEIPGYKGWVAPSHGPCN